MYLGLITAAVV